VAQPVRIVLHVAYRHINDCEVALEGIVSKRKDSAYRSGRSPDWLKMKNADAPAVKREDEEDWGKKKWR
jgi:ATP-dependent DNA ligase